MTTTRRTLEEILRLRGTTFEFAKVVEATAEGVEPSVRDLTLEERQLAVAVIRYVVVFRLLQEQYLFHAAASPRKPFQEINPSSC